MFNKKSIVLMLLILLCIGVMINSVYALDNSNSTDGLSISEIDSEDKLNSIEFSDEEAKDWAGAINLEEFDDYVEKSLPENDIQELRVAKNENKILVKDYTYKTSDSFKLVKTKSNTYKTVYVDKKGLNDIKGYKSSDRVYKKIPKSINNQKYNKKLSKSIWKSEWELKKIKKIKKTYKWKTTKWEKKKVGSQKVWVTKKIKTYESWIDDNGNLYKSKSWNPYKKYGYDIKYVKSTSRYYDDGEICYDYYKVKVNKPVYKYFPKTVHHKKTKVFYKAKLKKINYKKVNVPHKLTVFTRINKQPGLIHDYYYEGSHMIDHMYWK